MTGTKWDAAGNIAMQAWLSWVDLKAGNNEVIKEVLLKQMESLMRELSDPSPLHLGSVIDVK